MKEGLWQMINGDQIGGGEGVEEGVWRTTAGGDMSSTHKRKHQWYWDLVTIGTHWMHCEDKNIMCISLWQQAAHGNCIIIAGTFAFRVIRLWVQV